MYSNKVLIICCGALDSYVAAKISQSGIKPTILKGNRRYYNQKQVDKITYIKFLLRDKGLTIKGAKNILKGKKIIDETDINNIEKDYFKISIKNKSKNILKKIKGIKKHG